MKDVFSRVTPALLGIVIGLSAILLAREIANLTRTIQNVIDRFGL